jgi:hypothetical protein
MSALCQKATTRTAKKLQFIRSPIGAGEHYLQHGEAERRAHQRRSSLPAKFGNVGRDFYRQELQV